MFGGRRESVPEGCVVSLWLFAVLQMDPRARLHGTALLLLGQLWGRGMRDVGNTDLGDKSGAGGAGCVCLGMWGARGGCCAQRENKNSLVGQAGLMFSMGCVGLAA